MQNKIVLKEFRIIKKMNNKRRSNPSKLQNYQASRGDRNHKNDYNYKDERQDDLPRQRKLGYVEKLLNSFGFIQSVDDVSNSQGNLKAGPIFLELSLWRLSYGCPYGVFPGGRH